MMKYLLAFSFIFCSLGATFKMNRIVPISEENRLALVIGNSNYDDRYQDDIPNAANDADVMAKKLKELGFEVIKRKNLSLKQFNEVADEFNQRMRRLKESNKPLVTVFYYSGHGMHIDKISYLLPVNCKAQEESDLNKNNEYGAYPLHHLTDRLLGHSNFLNIVMLDACRTNKFPRRLAQGKGDPPDGLNGYGSPYESIQREVSSPMYYSYATDYGKIAKSGTGKNSPYVEGFIKAVETPNQSLEKVLKQTGAYVMDKTAKKQIPQTVNKGFYSDFIFNKKELPKDTDGDGYADDVDGCIYEYSRTNNGCPERNDNFVFVEGGTFKMGSNDGDSDEQPIHDVTVRSFYISKYEVTQKQWRDVMGEDPSYFKNCDQCPVESVSWDDIQEFIKKLNAKTGKNYRLPTEAEWEYAARGGNKSKGYKYSGSNDLNQVAWYDKNSYDLGEEHENYGTNPVGQKQPNELGIYDMSGNVWEWCEDTWHDDYRGAPSDGTAWISEDKTSRVLRGGSWFSPSESCRVAYRYRQLPE